MFSKIRDNLFLSSASDITDRRIIDNNIDIILNVSDNSRVYTNKAEIVKMGFSDDAVIAREESKKSIDFLCDALKNGKRVVVHCQQGASRSPHVVASALAILEDKDYHSAYKEVKELHPRTMSYSIGREIEDRFGISNS